MTLAIISDSHIPERESSIPEPFRERIAAADYTIHAGDFETPEVLADVEELTADLTAVHGNVDPAEIGLLSVAEVAVDGVTFVVTHGTLNPVSAAVYNDYGFVMSAEGWASAIADTARARTRAWDGEGIVGVGGHTHQVEDTVHEDVRVLNPGSVTGADPAEEATMLTVEVDDGEIDVTQHQA
ncbi:metallophosphoesterase family protein [Halosolutus halophilus]|uniref:metallophosphoesterase family protein n=1 Tax=Halosolutus halophilus TaxID=1552990 RepID=UPI002235253E|nr:metallophosphoesterase family protein [Halosolutus halophilus]